MKKANFKDIIMYLILSIILIPANTFAKADNCGIFGEKSYTLKLIKDAYNLIKFVVPILLLVLTISDYIKAIAAQNSDNVIKATKRFGVRIIISILILALPTILYFILDLIGKGTCKI